MVSKRIVSKKNLTVLLLVGTLGLMLAAYAQVEQLVIQLGFQALRMGLTAATQMREGKGGMSYDFSGRRNKNADPIWGNHKLFGQSAAPTEQVEKDSSKSSKESVEKERSAEESAKSTEDSAVKSVHGSIVGRAAKEKSVGEAQHERSAGSSDVEPEHKENPPAPIIMMNVSE